MASPNKEPMGKHFQNDQRRHDENETESHLKRGCVRTEETGDAEECLGAIGGQSLSLPPSNVVSGMGQHIGSAGYPFSSGGRPLSPSDIPFLNNRQTGINEVPQFALPEPAHMNRQTLIMLQQMPEHLRHQWIFNHWPHQRSGVTGGVASEERQYQIEKKKDAARRILTYFSDEFQIPMDEKIKDSLIERLESLF